MARPARAGTGARGRVGDPVSERELAVLRLLATELPLREIGGRLYVSRNTVKTHVRALYRKLGASRRGDAVARAHERGLLRVRAAGPANGGLQGGGFGWLARPRDRSVEGVAIYGSPRPIDCDTLWRPSNPRR